MLGQEHEEERNRVYNVVETEDTLYNSVLQTFIKRTRHITKDPQYLEGVNSFWPEEYVGKTAYKMGQEMYVVSSSNLLPLETIIGFNHVTALLTALWVEESYRYTHNAEQKLRQRFSDTAIVLDHIKYFQSGTRKLIVNRLSQQDYNTRESVHYLMQAIGGLTFSNPLIDEEEQREIQERYLTGTRLAWDRWRSLSADA